MTSRELEAAIDRLDKQVCELRDHLHEDAICAKRVANTSD